MQYYCLFEIAETILGACLIKKKETLICTSALVCQVQEEVDECKTLTKVAIA